MSTPTLQSIADAITTMENARPALNNPGNLMDPSTGQLASYPTLEAGTSARMALLIRHSNLTLEELFAGQRDASGNVIPGGYAGYASAQAGNDPANYAAYVSQQTGIPLGVPISSAIGGGATMYTSVSAIATDTSTSGSDSNMSMDIGNGMDLTTAAMIGIGIILLAKVISK